VARVQQFKSFETPFIQRIEVPSDSSRISRARTPPQPSLCHYIMRFSIGVVSPIIPIVIVVIKMMLILLVCRHVRYSSLLTWIFAAVGFIWLLILITLTKGDYLTRGLVRPYNKSMPEWKADTESRSR
jgi:caa(3)-type oxidase subunit IV